MQTPPSRGTLVRDTKTDRVGEVQDYSLDRNYVWLRTPGGGTGWQTRLDAIEPVQGTGEAPDA